MWEVKCFHISVVGEFVSRREALQDQCAAVLWQMLYESFLCVVFRNLASQLSAPCQKQLGRHVEAKVFLDKRAFYTRFNPYSFIMAVLRVALCKVVYLCALMLFSRPQGGRKCQFQEHLYWLGKWLWEVHMKHGLTFPRPNRHFLSYLLLWCLKCCFFSSPLRGQGWMWELRVAHEASVCAE